MNLSIRTMDKSDLEEVMVLENQIFPSPWSRGIFELELRLSGRKYLVVEVEGRIIGYSGVIQGVPDFHLTTMAVHPDFRRRSIGTRLMIIHLDDALAEKARRFTLEVRRSNTVAQDFYRRFGFRTGGLVTNYYSSEGEDAVVMWVPDLGDAGFRDIIGEIKRSMEIRSRVERVPFEGSGT